MLSTLAGGCVGQPAGNSHWGTIHAEKPSNLLTNARMAANMCVHDAGAMVAEVALFFPQAGGAEDGDVLGPCPQVPFPFPVLRRSCHNDEGGFLLSLYAVMLGRKGTGYLQ